MLTCSEIRPAGTWNPALAADVVVLDFVGRYRRRHAMAGQAGLTWLLDLPQATVLRAGDGLVLSDGRIVRVDAAPEPLLEITAPGVAALVRIAWHLGNRHLPTQLAGERLRIRRDHVMARMVQGLGGTIAEIDAPFDPEGGAFAADASHAHDGSAPAHVHPHGHGHHEHPGRH